MENVDVGDSVPRPPETKASKPTSPVKTREDKTSAFRVTTTINASKQDNGGAGIEFTMFDVGTEVKQPEQYSTRQDSMTKVKTPVVVEVLVTKQTATEEDSAGTGGSLSDNEAEMLTISDATPTLSEAKMSQSMPLLEAKHDTEPVDEAVTPLRVVKANKHKARSDTKGTIMGKEREGS